MRAPMLKNFSVLSLLFIWFLGLLSHAQENGQEPVAFTLGLNSEITFAVGSTLSFSREITRMGPDTEFSFPGVFTSPADGIYKFQVYALTRSSGGFRLEIYKNQDLVASLYGWSYNDQATTGNAVILYLNQGDEVSVQVNDQTDVTLYGYSNELYTTFSGVRMVTTNGTDTGIAFSATLTSHKIFNPGYTIMYDKLLLNQGNGYNAHTGVFTVPVTGVYIFHFFSVSETNEPISQDLFQNSQYICSLSGLSPTERAEAGNTVILQLHAGDFVQVKAKRINKLFGDAKQIYSTFSGVLIGSGTRLSPGSNGLVAFSAGLTRSFTLPSSMMVVFNRIFINLHNAFDQRTGNFTAPVQGLYEFNVHVQAQTNHRVMLYLYHNSEIKATVRANIPNTYNSVPGQHGTAGNSVILHMQVGDSVYLRAGGSDSVMYGTHDQVYCTFSGYLVAPTYTGVSVIG